MSGDSLAVQVPTFALPSEVKAAIKKSSGDLGLKAAEAQLSLATVNAKLKAVTAKGVAKIAEMNSNVRGVLRDLPSHAATVVLSGGAGAALGYYGYGYLRGYFGAGSYAPDIIVPTVGLAIGYLGAQVKDRADKPGGNAAIRVAAIGLGGGTALGGLARTYQTYVAA